VLADIDANAYFGMYRRLRDGTSDIAGVTHPVARRLLSRAPLIAHLLGQEKFSCSQVARLLAATEVSLDVPYGSITVIARKLDLLPGLDRSRVANDLWTSDQALSLVLFPDSTVAETNELAAEQVAVWLPEANIEGLLARLSKSDNPSEVFWPYLQMLHWCLTPIEYYDHPASYLYEFSPRGYVGTDLFARYPTVTGNPVLNNAKAVETLNTTWARNRGGDDAHALVALLGVLESLPFVPRRQVARVLRAWLARFIELCTVAPILLTDVADDKLFQQVATYVTRFETNTQGVIEQRVVDALAFLAYSSNEWRARGLADGVNATNLSRHKLGDVEFACVDKRAAVALEAHGGHLSATYVRDHTRSLARVIHQRLEESWEAIDQPANWNVTVQFIAHSRDQSGLPTRDELHGVPVAYEYCDYMELLALAIANSTPTRRAEALQRWVIDQLNQPTVRETARDKFREIASGHPGTT